MRRFDIIKVVKIALWGNELFGSNSRRSAIKKAL